MKKCSNCGTDVSYWGDGSVLCVDCGKLAKEGKIIIKKEGTSENESIKNEMNFKKDYQGSNKSGCYIATVCYGDENSNQVVILKKYRDQILVKKIWGKVFISIYYKFSPSISNLLRNTKRLNNFIKIYILDKIVLHITNKYYNTK